MHSGLTIRIQSVQGSAAPMCVSSIVTPLAVRALVTTTYTNGVSSSFYEQVINTKSTISSISTLSKGTAIADPLYVAWESKDLSLFPVGYATSLANKIGVSFAPTATPASTTISRGVSQSGSVTDSSQTGDSTSSSTSTPDSSGLSSSTKIGIGVGVGAGAALLAALIAMAFIIRRLRRRNHAVVSYPNESTPAMEGHGAAVAKNKWYHRARPVEQENFDNGMNMNELDSMPVNVMPGQPVELDGSYPYTGRY